MNNIINIISLIGVAVIPVAIILMYVYNKDKNKEPANLLVLLFLGGVFSCFLVLSLSNLLAQVFPFMTQTNTFLDLFLYAFVGVALIEEVCKFLMVYAFGYRHKAFDEIYDMLAYSIFVALGFACFENILYVISSEAVSIGISTGLKRAITAIPGHACDGLFMGYYLSLAKVSAKRKNKIAERNNILKSIFIPTVVHGIYDFCCFAGTDLFFLVFIIFIIATDIIALKKLNYVARINRSINEKPKKVIEQVSTLDVAKEQGYKENSINNNSVTNEANSYNQYANKSDSEYFTIAPQRPRPTASWNGDNFKFENSSVPYVPDLLPQQHIEEAPEIIKEQYAEYVPILPDEPEVEAIPEIPASQLPSPQKSYCVYCGAKVQGDFCSSCGHEIK